MPIYEYACAKCRETFEVIQRFSDLPLTRHEGCGGKLTKLVSVPSVRVKAQAELPGSTHSSILRTEENRRVREDKQKKRPAALVNLPARASKPAAKAAKTKTRTRAK